MEASRSRKCARCAAVKPIAEFYVDRRGVPSARCRACHGLGRRICVACGRAFEGRSGRKLCSPECRRFHRPRTWVRCEVCRTKFEVGHLARRFCSAQCRVVAQTTGRRRVRRTLRKARNAQSLVGYHVRAGNVVKPKRCEECGAEGRIEAAHHDYDRPLWIRWLCRSCHVKWDKREPKGATFVADGRAEETPRRCGVSREGS
jgi:hypothetical protein